MAPADTGLESIEMSAKVQGGENVQEAELDTCVSTPSFKAYQTGIGGASPTGLALANMERVGWVMWMLTVCAALSGSLFGYDTGYVSSVLVTIKSDLGHPLSNLEKELVTSATSLGALIGALCAALPSEWYGRKAVIALANVVFIVGAIVQAAATNVAALIAGRFVVGIGVGIASMIVPLWIGELAPTHLRGRLVTLNVAFLTLGQVIAYGVGAGFEHVAGGWRYTVAGGAVPAIFSLISMAWLPESPRYDSRRGRTDRAAHTFHRIFPHATEEYCLLRAEEVSRSMEQTRGHLDKLSLRARVRRLVTGANARALAVACGLQALQQLCGFNTLMYYSSTIFESVGFAEPVAVSLIVSGVNFVATLVAFKVIDIVGRRRIMLYTVPFMSLSLVFASICFHFLPTRGTGEDATPVGSNAWSYLLIVAIILFVLFYGLGTGNVPWQQGELFEIETRALATSIATATNWVCNLIIGATYLSLVDAITPSGAFGFYAGLCALGFVMCLCCFPDTRQLSLEEVHTIFQYSWGIKEADTLRAEKAAAARSVRFRDADQSDSAATSVYASSVDRLVGSGRSAPGGGGGGSAVEEWRRAADKWQPGTPPTERPPADVLDQWHAHGSPPSAPAADTHGTMSGTTPAAIPYNVPDAVAEGRGAESDASDPLTGAGDASDDAESTHVVPVRRSLSMPYAPMELGDEMDAPFAICPPPLVPGTAANPLCAYLQLQGHGLMLFVTCFASLGVFLFGYDQGVMSGILTHPAFVGYFHTPSAAQIGTMVAVLEIGALATSLMSGVLADRHGRKRVLVWGALIFSVGGALQTMATGYGAMVLGRLVSGFGVGFLSMVVPTYQSEVSPAENRGKLACIEFTGNIVGYMVSVWFDYFCSFLPGDAGWRMPLLMQPVIGLALAFGSVLLPESPRWLLDRDRDAEGMQVLTELHQDGDPRNVRAKLEYWEIKTSVLQMREQGDRSYRAMWTRLRYRTLIGMSSQACAQLNGINVISYYAPLVFESAGWAGRQAVLMTGVNAIVYVLSTVPTWFLVDSWGRRPILLSGALLCALMLTLCAYFLWAALPYTPQAVVVCVVLFNAAFGYSWGPIPWAWTPEIMPLAFRAKGSSLSAATNWLFNWIVGQATPVLQETIHWRLYLLHAFFCVCSFFLVYFCYPETQGVPLEEMDAIFGDANPPVPQHFRYAADRRASSSSRTSDPEVQRARRSISAHPRFLAQDASAEQLAHERGWLTNSIHRVYSAVTGLERTEQAARGYARLAGGDTARPEDAAPAFARDATR
ncbi:hypothetical protein MSPP1_000404 [Malassezia sp. CBS 17886]|nr:hypothetical protein MSPP1_000404 [Malassezia sp. CBS 17886]